jgi:hypothetical protein
MDIDRSINEASVIKYENIVLTTTIIHRTRYLLYRWFLVRLGAYIANLWDFYSYRLIGKLTAFFTSSGVPLASTSGGFFHFRRAAFFANLKSKSGNLLAKAAALRINLNLDGVPIESKSHTHPSHSQTSRFLTSSLSLGVPVPRLIQCMRDE